HPPDRKALEESPLGTGGIDPGGKERNFGAVFDAKVFELFATVGINGDTHILDRLLSALGRDDDFLKGTGCISRYRGHRNHSSKCDPQCAFLQYFHYRISHMVLIMPLTRAQSLKLPMGSYFQDSRFTSWKPFSSVLPMAIVSSPVPALGLLVISKLQKPTLSR